MLAATAAATASPHAATLVQDAWVRIHRAGADDVENLGGWLTTVVARVCLNVLRSRRQRREESLEDRLPDPIISSEDAPHPEDEALLADSVGLGAGARFRVNAPGVRFNWAEVTFVELERPHRIVEAGRTGKYNRIRTLGVYELQPAPLGATRVQFTLLTAPATISDRLIEGLGARAWTRRKSVRALRRLRSILELGEDRGRRVTVAAG